MATRINLADQRDQGVGSLVLSSEWSERVLDHMVAEICKGDLERAALILEDFAPQPPEQVLALGVCFRALGFAILHGASIPTVLLERVWNLQMAWSHAKWTNAPFLPLLPMPERDRRRNRGWHGGNSRPELVARTGRGGWWLAALAISEQLCAAGMELPAGPLVPWGGDLGPEDQGKLWHALQRISTDLGSYPVAADHAVGRQEDILAAQALAGRVLTRLESVTYQNRSLFLVQPALLVRAFQNGAESLEEGLLQKLLECRMGLVPVRHAAERQGADFRELLRWCWTHWNQREDNGGPPFAWSWHHRGERWKREARLAWQHLPPACMNEVVYKYLLQEPHVWAWLAPEVWERFLEYLGGLDHPHNHLHDSRGWVHVPAEYALAMLRRGTLGPYLHEARRVFWQRLHYEIVELVDELARAEPRRYAQYPQQTITPFYDLLYSAPSEVLLQLVQQAENWLLSAEDFPGVEGREKLRRWLGRVVEQHGVGWREAWALLVSKYAVGGEGK